MKTRLHLLTRILMALISLALGAVFFLPLWHIGLEAPQYPEGLKMGIWINRLSGDLNTINGLNHYIGMKEIHPESFAELRYIPIIVVSFMLLGLLTALLNRRALLTGWFGLLGLAGLAGLYDFWLWTYDYGHNLNPYAAIKVPGMSYQPPVFGSKTLLNFKAHSFPDLGGWLMIAAGFMVFALVAWEWLRRHPEQMRPLKTKAMQAVCVMLLLLPLLACRIEPEPIIYTEDTCHFCRMTLMDTKYGAERVTRKGKIFKFDSVECLVKHLHEEKDASSETHSLWVTDSGKLGSLIPAEQALYLYSHKLPSPMGAFLTPVKDPSAAETLQKSYPGQILNWEQVNAQLKTVPQNAGHAREKH